METNPHHLIMGELIDFLSGRVLADTHDERYRQKLARLLIMNLGYAKEDIRKETELTVSAGSQRAKLKIDFLVQARDKTGMVIKYAPGSLVTRRLSNLALSRIIHPYQIPVIVTTNGEDAEIIDGITGRVTGHGLDAVPGKKTLLALDPEVSFPVVSGDLFEKASRIAYACEIDGACPCDTDVCVLEGGVRVSE
ncbi:type I restriction enzyme HsdR N-terminal domain-containing protein [Desulfospira joergensenii]|uniref:type I restriction enzyme HsdR N-terminal domain-containing protein n=1 Tax=Desulfospira joergensenii TaxID=53329 RepID=UPI0003B450E9|nr:type I restriction enzyme HsdR N-terminal domain-containing protein [Desulfospira joergensenii]